MSIGAVFFHDFFRWILKRMDAGEPVLLNLDVLKSTEERATVACMGIMLFVGTADSFLLPLYVPSLRTPWCRASTTDSVPARPAGSRSSLSLPK